ncbi:hypothetical protein C806_01383 [Lachnospiraceae bacterium 3-1]|nr:hypothetical protein C806_01383 [Lachnospiraceae bacterium 3-1]
MRISKENYVIQLQLHNKKALHFFIAEHGEQLVSIIKKHLFTLPHLQQECLVDTVTEIWNHMDSFDNQNEFGNWVGAVARYRCLEFLRVHQEEATIPWLIEKEIAEEKEMMVSCLNTQEQELFYRFYVGEDFKKIPKKDGNIVYRNMYDLLNRIDTDIFEYEKESLTLEEKEQMFQKFQSILGEKTGRFSLKKYFEKSFQRMAFMNC